jgi:hypothetical protein
VTARFGAPGPALRLYGASFLPSRASSDCRAAVTPEKKQQRQPGPYARAMDDAQLIRRFERIEQQIRLLCEHLGVECAPFASNPPYAEADATAVTTPKSSGVPAEVVELVRAGKSTQAISTFRKLTGATLLEAKRVVDSL